jgi:uncharacterized membrane protein YgdD (TMEM256/DUF423 family)
VAITAWASHGMVHSVPAELLPLAQLRAHSASLQQLIHTLALLGVAVWSRIQPSTWLNLAGTLYVAGIVLFSMGIYIMHIWWPQLGAGQWRYLVPAGGMSFILGWLALSMAGLRRPLRL